MQAEGGVATDLDVVRARAQVETTAALIPTLQAQRRLWADAIARLLGAPPRALDAELARGTGVPPVPTSLPVGVPSDLLRRRPDIRAAEANLHAATADIGVAVADYFPRLTLGGSFALQGIATGALTDWAAQTYAAGPTLTLPIFQGGRIRRTVQLRRAQAREAALIYRRTVIAALHEASDALVTLTAEQRRHARLVAATTASRRALDLARVQYAAGTIDFLHVLDAERSQLAAEQSLAASTAAVSTDYVALYKALGGGWEQTAR